MNASFENVAFLAGIWLAPPNGMGKLCIVFMCGALVGCGGRLVGDGSADAADGGTTSSLEVDGGFICGEGTTFVICSGECVLTQTMFRRDYVCYPGGSPELPCGVATASAPRDCGCYLGPNGEEFLTICK